jgi:hypothetical protein
MPPLLSAAGGGPWPEWGVTICTAATASKRPAARTSSISAALRMLMVTLISVRPPSLDATPAVRGRRWFEAVAAVDGCRIASQGNSSMPMLTARTA